MARINPRDRILLAFDKRALETSDEEMLTKALPHLGGVKVGLEAMGLSRFSAAVQAHDLVRSHNKRVMWDAKFCDIPNTVGAAVSNAVHQFAPWGITLMAGAGTASVKAAVENRGNSLIIGVTVLTSISAQECQEMYGRSPQSQVLYFAEKLVECGVQAMVCSPLELDAVRKVIGDKLLCITPGIRAKDAPLDDQKRTMTASEAIRAGADFLVIGRPIMQANDPVAAAQVFAEEIAAAVANRSMV